MSDIHRRTVLEMTATKGSVTVMHRRGHCLPTSESFSKHLPPFFASIPGLKKELACRDTIGIKLRPAPERQDSGYME